MTNILLNITADTMGFAERMSYGFQVFVLGLGTVFSVLAILWLALVLFKVFAYDIPKKRAQKKAAEIKVEEPVVTEEPAEVLPEAESEDDTQLIAVITAAIAAYTSESGSSLPFRVVSFKRVSGANGWNSK